MAIRGQHMQHATVAQVHVLVQAQEITQVDVQQQITGWRALRIGQAQQQGQLPGLLLQARLLVQHLCALPYWAGS